MMRGRIARRTFTAVLTLAICVMAHTAESADFRPRRPSPQVVQARYRMQAQPIESADSMPQDGDVIYEGMSPEEIEMYGEPMPGQYAGSPEESFAYSKLYNLRPHRSHGAIAPQSHYYGYYPTRWRRWPAGWVGPKYQDGPAEELPGEPTPAESLPDPNMPSPGEVPHQMPANDGYGPMPGGQPAPGGMTPGAPTMLPDDEFPEQPIPLDDMPPLFPTDELNAPGLPADDGPLGLPEDGLPNDAPPGGAPFDGDTSQELPELMPPPGLPTDNGPTDPSGEPSLDDLPAPGTLDAPPPADDSGDAPRSGFSMHDDAPPRFVPEQRSRFQSSRQRRGTQQVGEPFGGRVSEGPRLAPAQTRPAPAVPHTASVAGHRGPVVNEFPNRELRSGEFGGNGYNAREYRNNQSVDQAPVAEANDYSQEGPNLWPAPGPSHSSQPPASVPSPANGVRPERLNVLPQDAQDAAPVDSFGDPALPRFPQQGAVRGPNSRRWKTTPSGETLRSQAASRSIDRAVRPAANWTGDGSTVAVVTANRPLTNEPAPVGGNPLRSGARVGSTTPPRRLPANMRANPLR